MLCYVMLCYVMLCILHVMLCIYYALLCYFLSYVYVVLLLYKLLNWQSMIKNYN